MSLLKKYKAKDFPIFGDNFIGYGTAKETIVDTAGDGVDFDNLCHNAEYWVTSEQVPSIGYLSGVEWMCQLFKWARESAELK